MIKLLADSTCDLSQEIIEKYDIGVAPLTITVEGRDYQDKIDMQPDEFYKLLGSLDTLPTTAMPSPQKFMNLIDEAIAKGYKEILCITMSSGTSGSYQSAKVAEEYFHETYTDPDLRIHVVDSKSMSQGSGYLILKSALLREQGANFDELVSFNERYKRNVKHFLSVDDLDNLIKSGRLTNVSAMIGKVLKVKPIMSMRDGKGAIVAKVRGRKKVFQHYIQEFKRRVDLDLTDFVIIGYTSDRLVAESLELKLRSEADFQGDIYIMQMGAAVGTHVGLGGLSMFFIEKGHQHDGLLHNEMQQMLENNKKLMKFMEKDELLKRFNEYKKKIMK